MRPDWTDPREPRSDRTATLALLTLSGLLGYLAASLRARRRAGKSPVVPHTAGLQDSGPHESSIASGIVGTARGELIKRFGPPVAASSGDYWQAITWYYPVDQSRHTGLAITFDEHVAREVEFIRPPAREAISK